MTCNYCGAETADGICQIHLVADLDWAQANRLMCDGLHRSKWVKAPPRGWYIMPEPVLEGCC